jgi:hypothetical protein
MGKHWMSKCRVKGRSPYSVWTEMRKRCYNDKAYNYKNYGGRGIKICVEWQEFLPFYEWAMASGYRDDLEIDRIDVNGHYEPSNCRWVTEHQQQANTRRSNSFVGVSYNKERKMFVASLVIGGQHVLSKRFKNYEDAKLARLEAERKHGINIERRNHAR